MSVPVNILVMIHGMIPNPEPGSPFPDYEDFWKALQESQPELSDLFPESLIRVEWGHELPDVDPGQLRNDQKLTRAQNFVNKQVSYEELIKDPHENNVLMKLFSSRGFDVPILTPLVRNLVVYLRETIITRGFGDVVYYCSPDGEGQIRRVVYGQVLKQLRPYLAQPDVRIHLLGQSLGVTLTHDFLYGLFHVDGYTPDFLEQTESEADKADFKQWREKAQNGELHLGSLTSTASQLPLFVMRKQKMVDLLAAGKPLDAADIGIKNNSRVQWKIFYDVDDILGFATRRLYNLSDAIMDIQVDTGDNPGDTHIRYWKNKTVIEETAKLLLENAQAV